MQKTTIDSRRIPINLPEILHYKDLLYFLVLRDLKAVYKQTILGFAWVVIRPLVSMVIFTLIFGKLAGIENEISQGVPYALFSYAALIPWTYFSTSITTSTNSLITGANILSKVYFPRIIIPLAPILAKMVDFSVSFVIYILLMFYYGIFPGISVIILPFLILILVISSFGISLWLSALSIQFRDVQHLLSFITQALLFLSPIIWPLSYIPERFQAVYALYPMVGVIEGFRAALIGSGSIPWNLILISFCSSIILLLSGFFYFKFKERFFADVA